MVHYYLIATLILSLANIAILMAINSKRNIPYYTTMFHVMTVQIGGHLFLAYSTNEQEALLANKIAYVGASFVPMLFFLGELALCNIKVSKKLHILLFSISAIILCLALTTGQSDIFYKSITLVENFGVTDFVAEYGPAHNLYNIIMGLYLISGLVIFFTSFYKKRNISYKNLFTLAVLGFIMIGSFFVMRGLNCDMVLTPAVFLLLQYTILFMIHRIGKYDIQSTILDTLEFQNESAYISFSEDLRYIGCNDIALHHFPTLKQFRVDFKVQESDELGKILLDQISKFNPNDFSYTSSFQYGKMHYKSTLKNLMHGNKICGYMFRIEDDTKIQRYIKLLDNYNNNLVTDVQNRDSQIQAIQEQMILGMANMVESRDNNTGGHIKRTSEAVKIIVNEMRKDDTYRPMNNFFSALIKAAPMHDLGKIAVDDAILRKPGRFTEEEFEIMKTHAEKGAAIVENLLKGVESEQFVAVARNVAHYHHERFDGTGYPNRLKGKDIPLEARIMAVADVYDALVSQRCYKEKMSYAEAYEVIVESMGTHFDPQLKKYFINCHRELEAYYDSMKR
ncbi:MAG: HD domain-containing protein [Fibrobacter sp.]|nr:HD domain-containing protein [Fibrobacter sp.]